MNKLFHKVIPVHKPQLPNLISIMPYLKEIDSARWYSNFGPLLQKFENHLAKNFAIESDMLTTAANGTLMLTAILKAFDLPENFLCIMPSWTFIATAAAAYYARLTPYFIDVDMVTQRITPNLLKQQLIHIQDRIGAVIVVAPFGAPIDSESWDVFTRETGIPVIIDAAAAFDTLSQKTQMRIGKTPIMVSLHATKVFGVGEGGLVLSTNKDLIKRIRSYVSFGFSGNREACYLGMNAKMSEYSAAIGLAALVDWQNTRKQWEKVRDWYIATLQKLGIEHCLSTGWVSGTCNVILPNRAKLIATKLSHIGIETREWWAQGCHRHPAYEHFPKSECLRATEWLGQSILGLPYSIDLSLTDIESICNALKRIIKETECFQHVG